MLCSTLLATAPALAQGDTTSPGIQTIDEVSFKGLPSGVLLVGMGAVVFVGGIVWLRENYPGFPGERE
jgi:hypothetical protein